MSEPTDCRPRFFPSSRITATKVSAPHTRGALINCLTTPHDSALVRAAGPCMKRHRMQRGKLRAIKRRVTIPFDPASRSQSDLAAYFAHFGDFECPALGGYIYQELCREIKDDRELLSLAAKAPTTQPPPNLLFAAVHYLLLAGEPHDLRQWYPELARGTPRPRESVFPPFQEFCLTHREAIVKLIKIQNVQTNVLTRCNILLPGFAGAREKS